MVDHIFNYHRLGEPNVLVDVADLYQKEGFEGFVDSRNLDFICPVCFEDSGDYHSSVCVSDS